MIRFILSFLAFSFICFQLSGSESYHLSDSSVDVRTGIYRETNHDILVPGPFPFFLNREFGSQEENTEENTYFLAKGWSWKIVTSCDIVPDDFQRVHLVPLEKKGDFLTGIQVMSRHNSQILSELKMERQGNTLYLSTHDGQLWSFEFEDQELKKVTSPEGDSLEYEYLDGQITRCSASNGSVFENELYHLGQNEVGPEVVVITDPNDFRIGRVKVQKSGIGLGTKPIIVASYFYRDGETEVVDSYGIHKTYRFQGDSITEIVSENQKVLLNWTRGKLQSKALLDSSGNPVKTVHYEYDENGRKTQETLIRESTDKRPSTTYYSYNEEGSLAKRWDEQGRYIEYQYDPESKLLRLAESSKYRTEFHYDDLGLLVLVSQLHKDSGKIKDTLITPSIETHAFGLPEMIEEVIWDDDCEEHVRKTVLYTYGMGGKVTEQTIIDKDAETKTVINNFSPLSFSNVWKLINRAIKYVNKRVDEEMDHCAEGYQYFDTISRIADHVGCELLGDDYMRFAGFHTTESETGIFGHGYEPQKYRITFINGILTTKEHLNSHMQMVSDSHGGCNIHYRYVGTHGWTNDLIRSLYCKIGMINDDAKELAKIWKQMIEDMGGVDSGGIIFHYAHSLGGTQTNLAKNLLTPEELKMIRVITMGSPTLIRDDRFHSVVNIISCRDIISAFDPIGFVSAMIFETNSFFVGSHWDGWPVVDHPFYSYWTYLRVHFWEEFEDVMLELQ